MSSLLNGVSDNVSSLYGTTGAGAIVEQFRERAATLERVFSNLDTEGKGYLDANDFATALESLGLESSPESDENLTLPGAEDIVSALDLDGDGKVSSSDLSGGMRSLTDSLSFLQGRASVDEPVAMPPPPDGSVGFTEEELSAELAALTEAGAEDEEQTLVLSSILSQFDTVDTDADGRVDGFEAMAFTQALEGGGAGSSETAESGETGSGTDAADATDTTQASNELLLMRRILQLVEAYGSSNGVTESSEALSLVA
jgi:hypothetical protein